ncbi:MAG: SDR family oxidoreductase [Anaerolineae bacterium]|nr:SDR family oxidoreductase [Anaerolineae bacterium]MDQ7035600.1 SDR family oxidoreductase [Anaerolineae bacterium]
MTERILITGSNRGIGLALVKEYLKRGANVIAACRKPDAANDLNQLKAANSDSLTIVQLDISNEESISNAAQSISEQFNSLDVLINNAGINSTVPEARNLGQLTNEGMGQVVVTNAIAPVIVTQALMNLLRQGTNPRMVMVSSRMGSVTHAGGNAIAYRMSKAAMNMAAKVLSQQMNGITVITTHPGHVATDMGGASAPVTPAQSAAGLADVIDGLIPQQTGKFYNYTGEEIPW